MLRRDTTLLHGLVTSQGIGCSENLNGNTIYAVNIKGNLESVNFNAAKAINFTPKIKKIILETQERAKEFKKQQNL